MSFSNRLRTVGALLAAVAVLGVSSTPIVSAAPSKGDPAKGKVKFMSTCIACHKADGSGGVKLTGNPTPNWKDPKTWADPKRKAGDDYLRECITNGRPASGMVAWGKAGTIKPAQIEDLIAFIDTIAKKK